MSDHISEFLLIVGPEWVEIPNASVITNQGGMDSHTIMGLIAGNEFPPITQWAEEVGLLTPPTTVVAGRAFDLGSDVPGEIHIRLWLVFSTP